MASLDKYFIDALSYQTVATQSAQQSLEQLRRDIYDSHRHRVFALAYYMTHNEIEAERLLVKTFTRGFCAPTLPNGAVLDGLLVDELRRTGILEEASVAGKAEERHEVVKCDAEMSEKGVRRTDLEEALQYLAPDLRLTFLLHDVESYSPEQIASLLEIPTGLAFRNVMRARIAMRLAVMKAKTERMSA